MNRYIVRLVSGGIKSPLARARLQRYVVVKEPAHVHEDEPIYEANNHEEDDDYDFYDDDLYDDFDDDPPLYAIGRIHGMTDDELIQEARRQCSIHDSAVDRCVEMGSPIIENAAARLNICSAECKRREIEWLWPDDYEGDGT